MNKRRCEVENCRKLVLTSSLEIRNGGLMCKKCCREEDVMIQECLRQGLEIERKEMIA